MSLTVFESVAVIWCGNETEGFVSTFTRHSHPLWAKTNMTLAIVWNVKLLQCGAVSHSSSQRQWVIRATTEKMSAQESNLHLEQTRIWCLPLTCVSLPAGLQIPHIRPAIAHVTEEVLDILKTKSSLEASRSVAIFNYWNASYRAEYLCWNVYVAIDILSINDDGRDFSQRISAVQYRQDMC